MKGFCKRVFDRFGPTRKRRRILDSVNELMAKEEQEHIADPQEQSIAYLSYNAAHAHSATQILTIVITLSALLVTTIFAFGTALERVIASSKANDSMQLTDNYYALAFAVCAYILLAVLVSLLLFIKYTHGTSKRLAVLEVLRFRSSLPPTTRMQARVQTAAIPQKRKPIFALIYVDRSSRN
ncbi:hypothetical protein HMPREF3160_02170 [Arthrobacter sp. HMSC06H05]|nr:hypothetical protein HMPREF3175_04040 [Arthrobacter sp. HMSC08H08]OFT43767.1 hypothetical protein HMPREF3160_02170 [Arthrobacter sp. HMSC06H05]